MLSLCNVSDKNIGTEETNRYQVPRYISFRYATMLSRTMRKTLRLYRNRFWAAVSSENVRRPSEEYRTRYAMRERGRRRRPKRHSSMSLIPSALAVVSALLLLLVAALAANLFLPSTSNVRRWRIFNFSKSSPSKHSSLTYHPKIPSYVPPLSNFTDDDTADAGVVSAGSIDQNNHNDVMITRIKPVLHKKISDPEGMVGTMADALTVPREAKQPVRRLEDNLGQGSKTVHTIERADTYTRTCYTNPRSRTSVCVHVPLCVRHSSLVYLAETLRCASYTNGDNKDVTMSQARCLELEKYVEVSAQMVPVERKSKLWLENLEKRDNILWFEKDAVMLRLSYRCTSIPYFAAHMFMLHHVLQHPERYGLSSISNVVIAAHEQVAKKIRYTKSWHHGLLAAIVHPSSLVYSHQEMESILMAQKDSPSQRMHVFVSDGIWAMAKSRRVPCFRRVAVFTQSQPHLFTTADDYPGVSVSSGNTIDSNVRYADADSFRQLLYSSLLLSPAPKLSKSVVYLHRGTSRTFGSMSLTTFQVTMRTMCETHGFTYRMLDMAGLTFAQQVNAVAGAGIAIGIHGTQMLNMLFLPKNAAVVEVMPYGFSNNLFVGGSGAGLWYESHQVKSGTDYPGLARYESKIDQCKRLSSDCRRWYQSDDRPIEFGVADAAAISKIIERAMQHVSKHVPI